MASAVSAASPSAEATRWNRVLNALPEPVMVGGSEESPLVMIGIMASPMPTDRTTIQAASSGRGMSALSPVSKSVPTPSRARPMAAGQRAPIRS